MATPLGHAIIGAAVARRLGVTSPRGLAAAVFVACLPDVDIAVSWLLHRDLWKLHRKATHTLPFALATGLAAGGLGFLSAAEDGPRDPLADALRGVAVALTHLALDLVPFPYRATPDGAGARARIPNEMVNVTTDAALYGAIAAVLLASRRPAPAR